MDRVARLELPQIAAVPRLGGELVRLLGIEIREGAAHLVARLLALDGAEEAAAHDLVGLLRADWASQ